MILQMSRESEMILIDLFECKSYSDVKETLLLKIYIRNYQTWILRLILIQEMKKLIIKSGNTVIKRYQ